MRCARALLPVAAALCACSSTPAPTADECRAGAHDQVLVVVSDYASSGVGGFSLDDTRCLLFGNDLGGDPALSMSVGRAFYIARDVGQIYELDPHSGKPTGASFDANRDGGSVDPQDIAVAPDGTLWVPLYTFPAVVAFGADGGIARTIDLSSYAPGGNPDANAIAIALVNGAAKAFVALEVLDNTQQMPKPYPDHPSLILPIDVATGAPGTPIPLVGRNPFGAFVPYGGALWMAEPGDFATSTETLAGVERFDPQTSTSSLVVREPDLGGSVAEVAITAGCGAAIIADSSPRNVTSLVTFDPATGAALTTAASPVMGPTADFDLQAMLWIGDVLVVGDRTVTGHGYAVHAFDRSGKCTLKQRRDTIFLQQKPVAFRAALP